MSSVRFPISLTREVYHYGGFSEFFQVSVLQLQVLSLDVFLITENKKKRKEKQGVKDITNVLLMFKFRLHAYLDQLLLCLGCLNLQGMHQNESCYSEVTMKVFEKWEIRQGPWLHCPWDLLSQMVLVLLCIHGPSDWQSNNPFFCLGWHLLQTLKRV